MCKIPAQHLKACERKVRNTAHFLYSKFTKRHNSFKNWRKVTTLELALEYIKTCKVMCKITAQYVRACRRKLRKTMYSLYSKFQKRHNSFKYTWAPQTVHNTPVMNILKGYFHLLFYKKRIKENKFKFKIFSSIVNAYRRQVQEMEELTVSQMDAERQHLNLICNALKQSHYCKISAQYVEACRRKVRKTGHFLYSKFIKRHNSFKNWRKVTTLELDV